MLSQQILTEFMDNCRHHDLIKARLVLDHFDQVEDSTRRRILFELNRCADSFAIPLLVFLSVRHHAISAQYPTWAESIRDKARNSPAVVIDHLQAPPAELNLNLESIATLRLEQAVPH